MNCDCLNQRMGNTGYWGTTKRANYKLYVDFLLFQSSRELAPLTATLLKGQLKTSKKLKLNKKKKKAFPGGSGVKESACNTGDFGFDPWIRKISWRKKWQSILVLLPGKSHGQRSLAATVHGGARENTIQWLHNNKDKK